MAGGIEIPGGITAMRLKAAQQQEAMFTNYHMSVTAQVYASLIHKTSNQEDMENAARRAVKAADALLAVGFGVGFQRRAMAGEVQEEKEDGSA